MCEWVGGGGGNEMELVGRQCSPLKILSGGQKLISEILILSGG